VLHHLPDPEEAFQNLLRYLKPQGEIQIYLYWRPEGQPNQTSAVVDRGGDAPGDHAAAAQRCLPRSLFPPRSPRCIFRLALSSLESNRVENQSPKSCPLKQYANFPFRVCVNDQLDRSLLRLKTATTRQDVADWLNRAQLEKIKVNAAYGWVGTGRKPAILSR